jgi:nitrite reductase (NADH) small subunit
VSGIDLGPGSEYVEVADVDSVAEGAGRSVEVRGRRFALFRSEGRFHLVDDLCPHRGASLGAGWFERGEVFCPLHGWAFNVATGACSTRPDRPVRSYRTMIHQGQVWAAIN